jgi:hypothetical protein
VLIVMAAQDLLHHDVAETLGPQRPLQQFMPQGCLVARVFRRHVISKHVMNTKSTGAPPSSTPLLGSVGSDLLKPVSSTRKVLDLNCPSGTLEAVACGTTQGGVHRCLVLPIVVMSGQD